MSVEPSPGHLGREPLAPVSALGSAERSPSHVTLEVGLLDEAGYTLILAGKQLAHAEEIIGEIDDELRAEAELYAALADGLAARLRSLR